MRLLPRRLEDGELEQWQPRLYLLLFTLLIIAAYVIAFIVKNDDRVTIDFVVYSAKTSLIWLIIFSLAIGIVGGVLLSQLYRRRANPSGGAPEDAVTDR